MEVPLGVGVTAPLVAPTSFTAAELVIGISHTRSSPALVTRSRHPLSSPALVNRAQGVVYVFDVTRRESLQHLADKWMEVRDTPSPAPSCVCWSCGLHQSLDRASTSQKGHLQDLSYCRDAD